MNSARTTTTTTTTTIILSSTLIIRGTADELRLTSPRMAKSSRPYALAIGVAIEKVQHLQMLANGLAFKVPTTKSVLVSICRISMTTMSERCLISFGTVLRNRVVPIHWNSYCTARKISWMSLRCTIVMAIRLSLLQPPRANLAPANVSYYL